MSGLVNAYLTDNELELLVQWGELANADKGNSTERHLLGKLKGMAMSVSCKSCTTCKGAEGETCAIPRSSHSVSPADVATR